jgi:hypothetical protein
VDESKQLPTGRKYAQSCHPGAGTHFVFKNGKTYFVSFKWQLQTFFFLLPNGFFLGSAAGLPDFSLVKHTKTGENIPNYHKISLMATK